MDDVVILSAKPMRITNNEVGEQARWNRSSMRAYVVEGKLKRIIGINAEKITLHLFAIHHIPEKIAERKYENLENREKRQKYNKEEREPIDYYNSIDLLKNNLIKLEPQETLELFEIYEELGYISMVDKLLQYAPIYYDKEEQKSLQKV